jgi:hypothetical protein
MTPADLIEIIRGHLATVLQEDDYDVQSGDATTAELYTDTWTIHLDGAGGFLAIDDEPDNTSAYTGALERALGQPIIAALTVTDQESAGALSTRLRQTADPLSLALADLLTGDRG